MVGEVAKPAYSLSDYPKSSSLSSRAVLTVSRNLRNNEIRLWLTQYFRAEPYPLQLARPEIFDDDVAVRDELENEFLADLVLECHGQAALLAAVRSAGGREG